MRFLYISLLLILINLPFLQAQQKEKEIVPKDTVPMFSGIWISTDVLNPILGETQNTYASYELDIEAGFKNRYYPIVEVGMSKSQTTSDEQTVFKSGLYPYGRIGMNYALIRSKEGFFYIGARVGYSKYKYDLTNVIASNEYWGEKIVRDFVNQDASTSWFEFLIGMRMNVISHLYLGWNIRYKSIIKLQTSEDSEPAYIPGYGKNGKTGYGIHFNIYYKF